MGTILSSDRSMIICPVCGKTDEPIFTLREVVICAQCGASLVFDGSTVRRAVHADIADYAPKEMQQLRRAQAAIMCPERPQR